jgi:S1-C subfamily serine protease
MGRTNMKTAIKIAVLSCIITGSTVYVLMQRRPATARPITIASADAPELSAEEKANIEVYEKCSAGVVNVTSTTLSYDFFLHPVPEESGTGSGAIIDDAGHIITNYHVVEGAVRLEVTLADQTKYPAKVIGFDANNDLAVLKIDAAKERLTAIPLGDSKKLKVGQKVLAIGNPYGLQRTMTTGIVSSLGREIEAQNGRIIEDVIQTDASVNPGNSGGPLLNAAGQMVGLNTAILSQKDGGITGIGFAVSSTTIERIANDLIAYGTVRRPYFGARTVGLSQYFGLSEGLGLNTVNGLLILAVEPDSPAARAGIRGSSHEVTVGNYRVPAGGDVILAVAGNAVESTQHLASAIDQFKPGDPVTLTLLRDNQRVDVSVTLGEMPNG